MAVFPHYNCSVRILMDLKEIGTDTKMALFMNKIYYMFIPHFSPPNSGIFPFERKMLSLCLYAVVTAQIQRWVFSITNLSRAQKGNWIPYMPPPSHPLHVLTSYTTVLSFFDLPYYQTGPKGIGIHHLPE